MKKEKIVETWKNERIEFKGDNDNVNETLIRIKLE